MPVLMHDKKDDVGIAVSDITAGTTTECSLLTGEVLRSVRAREAVPFGHKIALRDVADGSAVIEYGEGIGTAKGPIAVGSLVHVHNLRSARW